MRGNSEPQIFGFVQSNKPYRLILQKHNRKHRTKTENKIDRRLLIPRNVFEMENHAASDSKDPASFLSSIIGAPVTVKLNSGVVYKGELQSVDGYMNIALEKCAEYVNGQLRREYGDAFVRGNNVLYIST